ncbi:hypothetical protein BASA60_009762 [Batrachochytrium salamandrivorans]|nr:hypothetical protein BASA60_009762 [Batrachochytrium salamandrivorans]
MMTSTEPAPISTATTAATPAPKIRHEWFQTDSHITISVFIKNVDSSNLTVDMGSRSVSLHISNPASGASSEIMMDFELLLPILPSESTYEVLRTKIEVKLKKERAGVKWAVLEGDQTLDATANGAVLASLASVSASAPPSYPTSSQKKSDWGKIDKSVEEDKPEGDAALNALFQQIYKDASEGNETCHDKVIR